MEETTNALPCMGFVEAVKTCFKKYACFTGRARRSEYWWWWLFSTICGFVLGMIPAIGGIAALVLFLPSLAVAVRRLHDVDRSGWWLLAFYGIPLIAGVLAFIAMSGGNEIAGTVMYLVVFFGLAYIVSAIVLIVWTCTDGKPEDNQYGASPKYQHEAIVEA